MPDPIIERLTPPGRGAVAVVRFVAESASARDALRRHFVSASERDPTEAVPGQILYGHWGNEDVVVTCCANSTWEIHCHGGEAAVSRIASDLGGETSGHSDLNSPKQQLQTQLIRCRTLRTARYLLSQQQGTLAAFQNKICTSQNAEEVRPRLDRFLGWRAFAVHLSEPWKVAVIGQPNAGKSSLLNAVVGYERSIVFDQPGTTRDRVEAEVVLDGWPFQFVDTAGVRSDALDDIESIGVAAARSSVTESDACLLVVDSCLGWTASDAELWNAIPHDRVRAIVWNKTDIATNHQPPDNVETVLPTSVVNSNGIDELLRWLPTAVTPKVPDIDEPLPILQDMTLAATEFQRTMDLNALQQAVEAVRL